MRPGRLGSYPAVLVGRSSRQVAGGITECEVRAKLAVRSKEYEVFTSPLITYLDSLQLLGTKALVKA